MVQVAGGLGAALHQRLLATSTTALMQEAASIRDQAHRRVQTYRARNLIERFFAKLKHFRRVATPLR